ncbi:MAG TPA: COX15/CtaA family protein [Tepidisphaeraceae bacterium]|jgi:cytochrome c oxidase assembly protein subunit 15|nr:COX15/CtaA family protein [Tepidisphaeraceae bacterium]
MENRQIERFGFELHVQQPQYNRTVHGLALITAAATFPLIFMGGLVTSHQAGMSVPDWPNSWGYNMFTFPPSKWVGGILFEHTHRLAATVVGMLTIALMIAAWTTDRRRWVRWTAVGVFLACLAQGTIGGLRVVLSLRDLAIVHGCAAQLFFCFIAAYCVMTSRFWTERRNLPQNELPAVRSVLGLAIVAVAIILMQLVVGAIMRHSDAGLAIPDFPTSYGHLLPPVKIDTAFREEAIHRFGLNLGLNRVTLFQIWIHFSHRIGAVLVSIAVIALSAKILLRLRNDPAFSRLGYLVLLLLTVQVTLGILTVLLRKPADIASAHVAVGALLLVANWVIAVRAFGVVRATRPDELNRSADLGLQYAATGQ